MHDNNSELHPIEYQRPSQIQPEELISFISLPHYELHRLANDSCTFITYFKRPFLSRSASLTMMLNKKYNKVFLRRL